MNFQKEKKRGKVEGKEKRKGGKKEGRKLRGKHKTRKMFLV